MDAIDRKAWKLEFLRCTNQKDAEEKPNCMFRLERILAKKHIR